MAVAVEVWTDKYVVVCRYVLFSIIVEVIVFSTVLVLSIVCVWT